MMLDIRAWSPRARKVAAMGFAVCMILHSIVMIGLQLMDVTIPDIRTECEILSAEYRYTSERPFNDYDLRVTTVQTVLGAETWAATLDDDGFPTGSAANLFVSTKWTGNDTADIAALVGQRHSCFTRGRQRRLYRMGNSESYEVDDDLNLAVLSVISLCFMVPVYAGLFLIPSMRAYGPMINMVMFMAAFDFLWLILVLSMLYPSDKHCGVIAARTTGDGIVSIWTHVYRNGVGAARFDYAAGPVVGRIMQALQRPSAHVPCRAVGWGDIPVSLFLGDGAIALQSTDGDAVIAGIWDSVFIWVEACFACLTAAWMLTRAAEWEAEDAANAKAGYAMPVLTDGAAQ